MTVMVGWKTCLRFVALACSVVAMQAWASPWTLQKQFGSDQFDLRAYNQTRYEYLDGQFRKAQDGHADLVSIRTAIQASYKWSHFSLHGELIDSRQYGDNKTPINTGIVNASELVQSFARLSLPHALGSEKLQIDLGRIAFDLGSRHLIAHTRFRNTSNAFTGAHAQWWGSQKTYLSAFHLLPLNRLPDDTASLRDNKFESDAESSHRTLSGLFIQGQLVSDWHFDATTLYLKESDSDKWATANREITTAGFRLLKKASTNPWSAELETYYQWGQSRASTAADDLEDLDHRAWFTHANLGYQWKTTYAPTVQLLFDYASGDDSPSDNENNRFQRLYGVSRPDLGPTGIYAAFGFENISSFGLRLKAKPYRSTKSIITWRKFDLASRRDAWTKSKLRDPSGESGRDLGHQLEVKMNWAAIPRVLSLELGLAQLFAGDFMRRVSSKDFDSRYAYFQTKLSF